MALKFIKNSVDVAKAQNLSLKYRLHKKMGSWEPARDHAKVHASDLTRPDFCAREFCLCDVTGKKPKGSYVNTSLQATFDLGRSLQDLLNQQWGVEWCIGNWECRYCGRIYERQHRPEKCTAIERYDYDNNAINCNHDEFEYREVVMTDPDYGFVGSLDYIDAPGGSPWKVTEVKTIVKDDFKKLVAPLAEHRQRTTLYLHMASNDEHLGPLVNPDEATILYICKGYGCKDESLQTMGINDGGFSPFKEFTVKRDDEVVAPVIARGKQVHDFRVNGIMPSRVCPTSYCKRAKMCPVRKECWTEHGKGGADG